MSPWLRPRTQWAAEAGGIQVFQRWKAACRRADVCVCLGSGVRLDPTTAQAATAAATTTTTGSSAGGGLGRESSARGPGRAVVLCCRPRRATAGPEAQGCGRERQCAVLRAAGGGLDHRRRRRPCSTTGMGATSARAHAFTHRLQATGYRPHALHTHTRPRRLCLPQPSSALGEQCRPRDGSGHAARVRRPNFRSARRSQKATRPECQILARNLPSRPWVPLRQATPACTTLLLSRHLLLYGHALCASVPRPLLSAMPSRARPSIATPPSLARPRS